MCPRCMPQHLLEECVSRHNVFSPGPRTNVRPQCSCGSLYTLMCSLNSTNTLMLCTIDWRQNGWDEDDGMRQLSLPVLSSKAHCHISVSSSLPSTCPQMSLLTSPLNSQGLLLRDHQNSNVSSVNAFHRQRSGFGICLRTPNRNTRNELKVHLHARYLAVVLDSSCSSRCCPRA